MRFGRLTGIVFMVGLLLCAGCTGAVVQSGAPTQTVASAPTPALQEVSAAPVQAGSDQAAQQNEQTLQDVQVDLDHNGTQEQVQLLAGKDLTIKVGEQREVLFPDFQYVPTSDYTIYVQRPKLDVIDRSSGEKRLLVSVVWATNRIGSTAKLWYYKYESNKLVRVWESDSEPPVIQATVNGDRLLDAEIPAYGMKQQLELSADDVNWLVRGHGGNPIQGKTFELPGTTTEYGLRDYNGDGSSELMVRKLICLSDCAHYFTSLYTFFDFNDDTVKASKSFFAGSIEREIIDGMLKDKDLSVNMDKSDVATWFQGAGIAKKDVDRALNQMKAAGIIQSIGRSGVWRLHFPLSDLFPANNLKSIELSAYRSDSIKAQPELLTLYLKNTEQNRFLQWLDSAVKQSEIAVKPQKIYLLSFIYSNGEKEEGKYLAYVENGGSFYAKPFKMVKELNYDKFTKESIESIMTTLGKDDWFTVGKAPL